MLFAPKDLKTGFTWNSAPSKTPEEYHSVDESNISF